MSHYGLLVGFEAITLVRLRDRIARTAAIRYNA
jgi:hypothetical protein